MSQIALGDFNHDGYLDIVVTSQDDSTVLVLLNNGDGTFGGQVSYDVGEYPTAVAVGDFNNDGNLDILTANVNYNNHPSTVSILLNKGDGTFQSPQNYYPVGENPHMENPLTVAVGDFNRDGNLDIVTDDFDGNTVSVFLGNGDGTFFLYQHYSVGDHSGTVAVGDFTHDGNLDLVTTNGHFAYNAVTVSLGKGDGTFQPYQDYNVSANPTAVAVGDFNHDGLLDIVTVSQGGGVSVLLGKGDGTFQPYKYSSFGEYPIAVAVGDFNHDGNLDLVTANYHDNSITVLLGKGDGTFQSPQNYNASGNSTHVYPIDVAVGDVDNDGNLDIVTANGDQSVTVLLGNGDGTFRPAQNI